MRVHALNNSKDNKVDVLIEEPEDNSEVRDEVEEVCDHRYELNGTETVYFTYRNVKVEGDSVIVDTMSRKDWEADMTHFEIICEDCHDMLEWGDMDLNWE